MPRRSEPPAGVERARRDLARVLGPDGVLAEPLARALYRRDASMLEGDCALVAFPRSRDQVEACLEVAAAYDLPVVPAPGSPAAPPRSGTPWWW